jgi:hypothetical protein
MQHRHRSSADRQRGSIAVTATFLAIAISGLVFALFSGVDASKRMFDRGESSVRALEAAEAGVARAEQEIASRTDPGIDGIGTMTGTYGGANYVVTATRDPAINDQWTMVARGVQGSSGRQIEVRIRRVPTGAWTYGMFAQNSITLSGGAMTDSYDSRKGTYASQVTGSDKFGNYALESGPVGSNGTISVSSSEIHGDSNAGPGFTTTLSGTATVTGTNASLPKVISLPDTPLTTFVTAAAVNDNGSWLTTGGTTYNAVTKTLTVAGGNTLTLTKSTYFFSKIILSGNSTLKVTSGPVKLYVTDQIDFSGGGVVNTTNDPANLRMYQQAYALPIGYVPTKKTATLSGGTSSSFTYYGPGTPVTLSGGGDICGSVISKSIVASGGSRVHYDLALADAMDEGHAPIRRIYWRDVAPPLR